MPPPAGSVRPVAACWPKTGEGRVIKLEGNPAHPINAGKLCMRGQAALQGVYNPDRITTPLLREKDRWMPLRFFRGGEPPAGQGRSGGGQGVEPVCAW